MYKESDTEIRNRMLGRVPNDLDKLEGSFFYDVFSPVSEEFAQIKVQLDEILNRVFIQKAIENGYSEEIEMRALENGIYRKQGSYAIGKVTFKGIDNTLIPKDTIVQTESGLQFKTMQDETIVNGKIDIPIQAVEVGSIYVVSVNTICQLPVQILGVTEVINEAPTEGGMDIEDDESLCNRYFEKIQKPITSGNDNHYKQWALEVKGIGDAKVFPLWNGNGTVKIVIVDSNKKKPTEDLIEQVYEYIEEKRPIGAKVTITGAIEKQISVTAKVTLANGFDLGKVHEEFIKLLDKYFKDIAFELFYISIAKIGNILLNTPGVLDYSDLKVNNLISNIGLQNEEIPVLGNVELGV